MCIRDRFRIGARLMHGPIRDPPASPRALRGPIGTQRTAGGTVGPRLIGASPVWAARSSYWRQPRLLVALAPSIIRVMTARRLSPASRFFLSVAFDRRAISWLQKRTTYMEITHCEAPRAEVVLNNKLSKTSPATMLQLWRLHQGCGSVRLTWPNTFQTGTA